MSSFSSSSPLFPRHSHCAARQTITGVGHRSFHQSPAQQLVKRPALLLIAGSDLLSHLARFLGGHGYIIYAGTDAATARAILMRAPIDLLLLHCAPELSHAGWETYTELRQLTTKPILMVANIAVDHFTMGSPMTESSETDSYLMESEQRSADLAAYLHVISLACNTMLS